MRGCKKRDPPPKNNKDKNVYKRKKMNKELIKEGNVSVVFLNFSKMIQEFVFIITGIKETRVSANY